MVMPVKHHFLRALRMTPLTIVLWMLVKSCHLNVNKMVSEIYQSGDIVIGAILSINGLAPSGNPLTYVQAPMESNSLLIFQERYQSFLTLLFAIDEINKNAQLLPNISLGFHIYESFVSEAKTLDAYLRLLTETNQMVPNYRCSDHEQLVGIVGLASSVLSILAASTFGMYGYPQISYGSTDPLLSNRMKFPYFYRTVPSEHHLYRALSLILKHFGWNWIGIIYSDDESSENAIEELSNIIVGDGACIDFKEKFLSVKKYISFEYTTMAEKIMRSSATVILFWADLEFTFSFYSLLNKFLISNKVWLIVSDMEHLRTPTIDIDLTQFHGSLAFQISRREIPGLMPYLLNRTLDQYPETLFKIMFKVLTYECPKSFSLVRHHTCRHDKKKAEKMMGDQTSVASYRIYNAIYALAYALHGLFSSRYGTYNFNKLIAIKQYMEDFHPMQLHQFLKNINFKNSAGENMYFDHNGDAPPEYDVYNWVTNSKKKLVGVKVGTVSFGAQENIFLNKSAIVWSTYFSQNTSVVRSNNRNLSFLLLLSLTLMFLSCLVFIGLPGNITCILRQPLFGITFTICVSSVLAKTIIVVLAFHATKPGSQLRRYLGQKLPFSIVALCSFFQVLLCSTWVGISTPYPFHNFSEPGQIIIECQEGFGLYIILAFIGLLASGSFVIAFFARNLPDVYNEAKFITFSMLVFFSIWVSFLPTYLSTKGKNMVAVEIFAILMSGGGILVCMFFPKCYIIFVSKNDIFVATSYRQKSRQFVHCNRLK
ncbi:vomeronasal type-2 receptor 26-like [Discoglossus pictus]